MDAHETHINLDSLVDKDEDDLAPDQRARLAAIQRANGVKAKD